VRIPLLLPILALTCSFSQADTIRGQVVAVDKESRELSIRLDSQESPQTFAVGAGDAAIGYLGQEIVGEPVDQPSSTLPRLNQIWPDNLIERNAMDGVNRSLIREAALLGRGESLSRGDYLPDFALYNQRGEPVFASQLKNSPTVLTFIFTRCAVPQMCPATSARLSQLGQRAEAAGWDQAHFVAVSFDPDYDTPGILNQYASAMGMDGEAFELLTGDLEAIEALLRLVGVRTIEEDGTIVHNLVTLLADDHGRIVLRQDGSRWSADAIYQRMEKMFE